MNQERPTTGLDQPAGAPAGGALGEVLKGLSRPQKELPCKLFYDRRGSELFDRICGLPEYYPTRTETAILRRDAGAMIGLLGDRLQLVEYGSGSSEKTRLLLDRLQPPSHYVPIDISCEYLRATAHRLGTQFRALRIVPLCADYTGAFELPPLEAGLRRVIFFPGSTIGNFHPTQARRFLARIGAALRPAGALLIGVDLRKSPALLEAAYNDAEGVTAEFNLNLLRRLNRELGADFDSRAFSHHAFYSERAGRVEMYLVSRRRQQVHVGGRLFVFEAGESILTECSYKYTIEGFAALANEAGLQQTHVWTDPDRLFSVQAFEVITGT